jgi:hypothetical protein
MSPRSTATLSRGLIFNALATGFFLLSHRFLIFFSTRAFSAFQRAPERAIIFAPAF